MVQSGTILLIGDLNKLEILKLKRRSGRVQNWSWLVIRLGFGYFGVRACLKYPKVLNFRS